MKKSIFQMVFKGICFVLLAMTTLISQPLNAQSPLKYGHLSRAEKEQKSLELINGAEYMAEGKIIESEYVYTKGDSFYSDMTFEVTHWYKGKKKERIIHIASEKGKLNQEVSHAKSLSLGTSRTYIFLLKKMPDEMYKILGQNDFEFTAKYKRLSHETFYISGFTGINFNSFEEFNAFLKRAEDIKLYRKKKDLNFVKSSVLNPVINDLSSPDSDAPPGSNKVFLQAGVGDILIISGENFGAVRGKVRFRDADKPFDGAGNPQYIEDLNAAYYVPQPGDPNSDGWTDTKIVVRVPSEIYLSGEINPSVPGSGFVVVELPNDGATAISNEVLTIEYSISTSGYPTPNIPVDVPTQFEHLGKQHCTNGFVFTLHTSFMQGQYPSNLTQNEVLAAKNSVEMALEAWSQELGITLQLEQKGGVPYNHPDKNDPNRNMIYFQKNLSKAMLTTSITSFDNFCEDNEVGCTPGFWRKSNHIAINPDVKWLYNPSSGGIEGVPTDFHAAILHEIGHALGLKHTIDYERDANGNVVLDDETMLPTINYRKLMSHTHPALPNGESPSARITLDDDNSSEKAVIGAERIVESSRNKVWSNDFTISFGVETLSEGEHIVLQAPSIDIDFGPVLDPISQVYGPGTYKDLVPNPDETNIYDYYWARYSQAQTDGDGNNTGYLKDGVTTDELNADICKPETYYVRIKNAACNISSPYSLPLRLPYCARGGSRCHNCKPRRELEDLMVIYPNPTNGHFDIQFKSSENEEKISELRNNYIVVYDMLGSLHKQYDISDATIRQTTIDISTLPAGTYWVVWFADGEAIDTQQLQKTN